jgi:predicted nucleic acid-binding Zn ribbon protein
VDRAFGILLSLQRGTAHHGRWVVECLAGSWDRLVGKKLATVCRPAQLKNTELKIEVLDDSWMDVVRGMKLELQEKLSSATSGEVKKLKISVRQLKSS